MSCISFSEHVYKVCFWCLLTACVLLAVADNCVVLEDVRLSISAVDIPVRFLDSRAALRFLAVANWVLILVIGRWCDVYARKCFVPIAVALLSLCILLWRFSDIVFGTPYQDVSRWWFVLLLICGYLSGIAISCLIDGWAYRRTDSEMKETGLPRTPIISHVYFRQARRIIVLLVVVFVLFFIFYHGPFLLPLVWFLSFTGVFIQTNSDDELSKILRTYSDYTEYNAILNLVAPYITSRSCQCAQSRLSPQQVQAENVRKIKAFYGRCIEDGRILSHSIINQCGEQILRIVWRTKTGKEREVYLGVKQAYKYWEAYQWLCHNDKEFSGGKHVLSEEKCLLYAVQDHQLKGAGLSLLGLRISVQDDTDLEVIIKATSSINKRIPPGWTLLLYAVANGFLEGARLLLKYGADTELANDNGATPILYAVRYDNAPCLNLLIDAGAKVCAEDNRGYTALMIAAEHNCKSVVPILLKEGVDIDKRNFYGERALDIALARQAGDIASMLRNSEKKKVCQPGQSTVTQ